MNAKQSKKIRREVKRKIKADFNAFHNMICDEGFKVRARIAWQLIRGKKRK
jgi:hypothetical protein